LEKLKSTVRESDINWKCPNYITSFTSYYFKNCQCYTSYVMDIGLACQC